MVSLNKIPGYCRPCPFALQRFLPSEFGHDVDRADPVEPGLAMYKEKRRVRRVIEEMKVPYTYICCNSIASWPYYDNHHPSEVLPPLDQFQIYGDGTVKGACHMNSLSFFFWNFHFFFLCSQFVCFRWESCLLKNIKAWIMKASIRLTASANRIKVFFS